MLCCGVLLVCGVCCVCFFVGCVCGVVWWVVVVVGVGWVLWGCVVCGVCVLCVVFGWCVGVVWVVCGVVVVGVGLVCGGCWLGWGGVVGWVVGCVWWWREEWAAGLGHVRSSGLCGGDGWRSGGYAVRASLCVALVGCVWLVAERSFEFGVLIEWCCLPCLGLWRSVALSARMRVGVCLRACGVVLRVLLRRC